MTYLLFVCVFTVIFGVEERHHNKKFIIESTGDFTDTMTHRLRKLHFRLLFEVTSTVHIVEYHGVGNTKHVKKIVREALRDEIHDIEPTRNYNNTIKPVNNQKDDNGRNWDMENLTCSYYYGMDVENVWARNITGTGVTMAVNDVGIDTDLQDREKNINKALCKNFFTNTSNVSPDHVSDLLDNPNLLSEHGNQVTSITAAVKKNNLCSAGIAYNATIVGLKMFMIKATGNQIVHWTESEIVSRALKFKIHEIDIFVNAWAPQANFDQLDLATRKSIEYGALKGRRGLGTIHIVPAGSFANILSNNIHTITVNGVPRLGEKRNMIVLDSSVLVSGLRDGNNLTATSMVTTSYGKKCVRRFHGVSAAVSQVAGIIALGLQANPKLTLRDVQHLLVQASEHEPIAERAKFKTNGASKKFNEFFGFGLLNAETFVNLSEKHKPVPDLLLRNLVTYSKRNSGLFTQIFEFCYKCEKDSSCLTLIEHVTLAISFTASNLTVELISPSATHSMLMDLKFGYNQSTSKELQQGEFVPVQFWGEEPFGKWNVKVRSKSPRETTTVHSISLTLHGTSHATMRKNDKHCGRDITHVNSADDNNRQQLVPPMTKDASFKMTLALLIVSVWLCLVVYIRFTYHMHSMTLTRQSYYVQYSLCKNNDRNRQMKTIFSKTETTV